MMQHVPEVFCYAPASGLMLDLYRPSIAARAVVLYLHGGGFIKGSRRDGFVPDLAARLLPEGVAVVAADYRLGTGFSAFSTADADAIRRMQKRSVAKGMTMAPRLFGPAMIAALLDASAAVQALKSGIVPGLAGLPVIVCGISAGGIAGLSLAYPPREWALAQPDAVFAISAAMVQPWRLRAGGPPCVMLHGQRDRVIGIENPRIAMHGARARGVDIRLIETEIKGHNPQASAFLDAKDSNARPYFAHFTDLLHRVTVDKPAGDTQVAP